MTSSEEADLSALHAGILVGEYQITHKIGEGGMGVVYAGTHPEIGKRVAIKVLTPHAAAHPDLIRRFKEEARAVNKIRHPNIIDIFAFNQLPDGRHYFVMEYLEGENLTARLERGPIELGDMRRLLGQICSALQAAHQAGVVHRDLKPDNIWVATEGTGESRIKLLDFGIAKLADLSNVKNTQAGVSLGTPHYMPPEQGLGRAVDHRADIYALGVVMYQIFAGTLPFDGATAHEIVLKHVTEAPLPPSRHRPIALSGMESIILGCMEKAPERRPQSVKELWSRIDAVFAQDAIAPGHQSLAAVVPALTPASNRTEILPEAASYVPGGTAAIPSQPTTLRGSVGEMATTSEGDEAELIPPRGKARKVAVIVLGGAALATIAVFAVASGRSGAPDVGGSAARQAPATTIAPPASAPAAPEPPKAPPVPEPAAPTVQAAAQPVPPNPASAASDGRTTAVAATVTPKPTHVRKSGHAEHTRKTASMTPEHQPATKPTKPNCNPNFTLDAQGEKHFKPECF